MKRFVGETCPVCKQKFASDDDIVVCPECGAPYHRSCYTKQGKCAYEDKHGQGWTIHAQREQEEKQRVQQQEQQSQVHSSEHGTACNRCGTLNPIDGLFCVVCGNTLRFGENQPIPPQNQSNGFAMSNPTMFSSPLGGLHADEKIGDIPAKDFAAFVGNNAIYYLPKFKQFSQHKSVSINLAAFCFPSIYYLYRKMYPLGILFLLTNIIFMVFNMILSFNEGVDMTSSPLLSFVYYGITVVSILSFVLGALSGVFANRLYYQRAIRVIKKCQLQYSDPQEYVKALLKKGSVSMYAVAASLISLSVVTMIMMYVIMLYQ